MTKRRNIIKALEAAGFISKGGTNHEKWAHEDGRTTIVGRHKDIPLPTARLIAKQAKIKLPK
ncbi:type II toxin-antitoxin system HicA family toxin [Yoonia sp. R2-816]|uniref:type II toxin-antitoxin system HicA family toxin n=1 Tax=Yoonia sp. R2-816 TaxID=3342638 RepID=UPI003727C6FD